MTVPAFLKVQILKAMAVTLHAQFGLTRSTLNWNTPSNRAAAMQLFE